MLPMSFSDIASDWTSDCTKGKQTRESPVEIFCQACVQKWWHFPALQPAAKACTVFIKMSTEDPNQAEQHGENYEEEHVHAVYEQIASHFSSTRYKVFLSLGVVKSHRH